MNVQHDCQSAGCWGVQNEQIREEREETHKTRITINHIYGEEGNIFLLNTPTLHNYRIIELVTPPELRIRAPFITNGQEVQRRACARMQAEEEIKKAKRKAKRAATKAQQVRRVDAEDLVLLKGSRGLRIEAILKQW